jgi:hypothetical protein
LLEEQLERAGSFYGGPGTWIAQGLRYLDEVPPRHGAEPVARQRLWLVIQGDDSQPAGEANRPAETARRAAAAELGAGMVVVARTRLDQSYEPRFVKP